MKKIKKRTSKKAVVYTRVSTTQQVIKGGSLPEQKINCTALAKREGLEVAEYYEEKGKSGTNIDGRPEMIRMLDDILKKGSDISYVICWHLSRLARNPYDYAYIKNKFEQRGIKILYVDGTNDDTLEAELVNGITSHIAGYESKSGGRRTINGNRNAIRDGRWIKKIKGYDFAKNSADKSILVPNKDAKHIIKLFNLAELAIYTKTEIRKQLSKDGYYISKQSLDHTFKNSVYCGLLPDIYNINNGEYIKGKHKPLISEATFFAVQRILKGKKANYAPRLKNNPMFPLRRYVVCHQCGKLLTAANIQGKKIKVPYYYCTHHKNAGFVQKGIIENKYLEYYEKIKPNPKLLELFEKLVIDKFNTKTQEEQTQKETAMLKIETLKKDKSKTIDLMRKNKIDEDDGAEELKRLNEEISTIESIFEDTEDINVKECWSFTKFILNNAANIWKVADLDTRQRLQGLITPSGFYFKKNLIKPLKSPYLLGIFQSEGFKNEVWGG